MSWSEAELPQGAGAKRNSRREQERSGTPEKKWRGASYASGVLREGASPRSETAWDDGSSPLARSAMLIARLVENLATEQDRVKLAEKLVEAGQPISFSAEIIKWLRTDQSRYPNSISDSDREKLSKILAERISKQVSEGQALFDEFPEQTPWLFTLLSKYKSRDDANQYLKIYINEEQANIYKVLESYVPTAYPMMGSGLPHKSDFTRDEYNSIANSFDPSIIYSKLESIYGNDLKSEEYPRFTEDPTVRIASQFMWLHKIVQAEKKENSQEETIES